MSLTSLFLRLKLWRASLAALPLVVLGPVMVPAVHAQSSSIAEALKLPFERYRLDNGLEVILHQDKTAPLVTVNVWYHVGSGDEVPGKSGFAHLFEHMMFQGSKHTGADQHFAILQQAGASDVNGTTSSDRTNYYQTLPAHELETALWLESDRMGFLLDSVTEESFRNQVDVVRNERRQRYDNVPYGQTRFAWAKAMYPEGHPYRYLTIGLHEDLENATLEDVRGFFKTWYGPANATLAIAGDFEPEQAKALVQKWFGNLKGEPKPQPREVATPSLSEVVTLNLSDPFAQLTQLNRQWFGPKALTDEVYPLETALDILGAQGWGRLYKRLVVKEQLCTQVTVYFDGRGRSGEIALIARLKPQASLERVRTLVNEEIARLIQDGVSEAEVKRSIANTRSAFVWSLEDLGQRIDLMQHFNHFAGDPNFMSTYIAKLEAVTAEQVKAAAARWLGAAYVELVSQPAKEAKP